MLLVLIRHLIYKTLNDFLLCKENFGIRHYHFNAVFNSAINIFPFPSLLLILVLFKYLHFLKCHLLRWNKLYFITVKGGCSTVGNKLEFLSVVKKGSF